MTHLDSQQDAAVHIAAAFKRLQGEDATLDSVLAVAERQFRAGLYEPATKTLARTWRGITPEYSTHLSDLRAAIDLFANSHYERAASLASYVRPEEDAGSVV